MRLGQLARKLSLKPAEIVEFLATKNIVIDDGSNTRLSEEQVELIVARFAPGTTFSESGPSEKIEEFENIHRPEPIPSAEEAPVDEISLTEAPTTEKPDVIKAPKVELAGLKVVGKIELPEVKKKEVPQKPDGETNDVSPDKRKASYEKKSQAPRNERRPVKNPIAAQREREALDAEKKRRAALEREKEQKKKNYFKKVRTSAPTKSARYMKESVEEFATAEKTVIPKTWLGKLIRWFRT